ncbi:MAG: phosphoglycerate kinase [Endomicrobium sp.]|jgi:phosphoglycerate kinase|nr:phosphoglycerate kinase [Endomicrobium sp.]
MKRTIRDIDVNGKKVLLRVDYNVPLSSNIEITDDSRIVSTIETLEYLLNNNAAVIIISHLGRPNGKFVKKMSLMPVSIRLSKLLNRPIKFVDDDCISLDSKKAANDLRPGEVLLLENLRFHPEEEGISKFGIKDNIAMEKFAKELSSMGDVFVQDAFGVIHRSHASTTSIVKYVSDAAVGFLVEKELNFLGNVLKNPNRPFLSIIGGAKVSDKINIIESLLNRVDAIIIAGAMSYTFLKSLGVGVGDSLVENDKIELSTGLLKKSKSKNVNFLLPIDHIVTDKSSFSNINNVKHGCMVVKNTLNSVIDNGFIGVDIGSKSISKFSDIIKSSKTIFWNGPLGIFEIDEFSTGTIEIAKSIANRTSEGATSVIGGGDSISAIKKADVGGMISHISTGGGASLEFIEDKELPGIVVIPNK